MSDFTPASEICVLPINFEEKSSHRLLFRHGDTIKRSFLAAFRKNRR